MPEDKAPEVEKAPVAEAAGVPQEDREVMVPYAPKKGWVKDTQGRFHEVDDSERFVAAYPGSEVVKAGDVVKSKVGYADEV